ncbi:MAG: dihydropteroate synthase [Thermonemataceae bacterium]
MKSTLNVNGKILKLTSPQIVGILNVTPDSFFDGGQYEQMEAIIARAAAMLEAGADWLDVGGYSSRPNATPITVEEELHRVIPTIKAIQSTFPTSKISVDTFRAEVANKAVQAGAHMINDISGGTLDDKMFETVAALQVPYILMHMRGNPQTMQSQTTYENILVDILSYFRKKILKLEGLGVKDIIIDVGLGFAKTLTQNYFLLNHLEYFKRLNKPLLVGASRKSMIYKLLGITPSLALNGTTAVNTLALCKGANLLRVHDVKEAKEVVTIFEQLSTSSD